MKVVICGAGLSGLTLANRVATLGGEVVLLERAPRPRPQGYMIDFFGPGYDAVTAMGLLPAVEEIAYDVHGANLLDEHGRTRATVNAATFAAGSLLSLMRPDLERVLREHLPTQVDLRFGAAVTDVTDHGHSVQVTLDGGERLDADLVVGADGIHSTVRRHVFGSESRFLRYLGFHTAAFIFDAPAVHDAVADRFCMTDTIGRQMGFYALRDGRVATFAVHRTSDPTVPRDVRAAVRDTYRGLGWVVPQALEACPPAGEIYYDQVAQIVMPTWSTGRVVLLGDACYAVSLLAGQGASLGIAGAYLLADQLARTQSISDAVTSYERLWRPVVEEKQKVARDAARWFLPGSATQLWLRRVMLRMARLPVVDRVVAGAIAGKSTALIKNLEHASDSTALLGADPGKARS